ncbi:hypothetical protein [Nitrososphaera sp.]|uniref:hypothetical protein n=1 Tax=Nitrososphaera sp. TaxID=1971748 RepID=UPI00307E8B45
MAGAGIFLFLLSLLANVAYLIQGACYLSSGLLEGLADESCTNGFTSQTTQTRPIASTEFAIVAVIIAGTGAALFYYSKNS